MTQDIETYFAEGCGRCPLGGTPDCKVHTWQAELAELHRIVLATGLEETVKWGVPCYMHEGNNVLLISAFKGSCTLSFFKGALLKDPSDILEKPGENSQATRMARFTDVQRILELESVLISLIREAMEVEKAGLKIDFKAKNELEYPEELIMKFEDDPVFKASFEALTPGRQRGYILHISGAKQSKTRMARIEKWAPNILEGRGMHDR